MDKILDNCEQMGYIILHKPQGVPVKENSNWFFDSDLSKGQLTQLRIIQTAIKLFGKKGFAQTTLQAIAKSSKTSHPLILRHFKSKDLLLRQAQQYVSQSNHRWVDAKIRFEMSGHEALHTHCIENLEWAFHNRDEARIILLTYYYNSLSGFSKNVNARRVGADRILKYVKRIHSETELSEPVTFYAEMIQEFIVGQFVRLLTDNSDQYKRLPTTFHKKISIFLEQLLVD